MNPFLKSNLSTGITVFRFLISAFALVFRLELVAELVLNWNDTFLVDVFPSANTFLTFWGSNFEHTVGLNSANTLISRYFSSVIPVSGSSSSTFSDPILSVSLLESGFFNERLFLKENSGSSFRLRDLHLVSISLFDPHVLFGLSRDKLKLVPLWGFFISFVKSASKAGFNLVDAKFLFLPKVSRVSNSALIPCESSLFSFFPSMI